MIRNTQYAIRTGLALLPALLAILAACYVWVGGPAVRLDVGAETDAAAVENFYARERGGTQSYRWGQSDPQIRVPAVAGPALLTLRMAGRAGGTPVALDGAGPAPAAFMVKALELRRYALLAEAPQARGDLVLTIGAEALAVPPEKRALSVLVESARVEPLRVARLVPPAAPLALLGMVGMLAYALPLLMGGRERLALPVGVAAGVGLALAWGGARVWVAPYLGPLVAGGLAVAGLLALLRARAARAGRVGAAELLACLLASGAMLPLWRAPVLLDDGQTLLASLWLAPLPLGLAALWARGRPRGALLAAGVAAALLASGVQLADLLGAAPDLRGDFHALYRGAARLHYATLPLYNLPAITSNPFGSTFTAPPVVAALLLPLAGLPLEPALAAWRAASLAALALAAGLLLAAYRTPLRSWPAAGLLLALAMAPAVSALGDGQLSPLLLVLVALACWGARRGRWAAWGAGLGVAAALSPGLLALLLSALARLRWRALLWGLAALTLVVGAGLALAGAQAQLVYALGVLPNLALSTSWVENQSLAGFVNRLYETERLAPQPGLAGNVRAAWIALDAALLALTLVLTRAGGRMRDDHALGLWLVAALLALPAAWIHQELLLVPVLFQALVLAEERGLSWPSAACYTLAWLLIGQGDRQAFYDGVLLGPFWQLILSYKCYGLVLLYVGVVLGAAEPQNRRATEPQKHRTAELRNPQLATEPAVP